MSFKYILICVVKMNEGLEGLEQHEGEKLKGLSDAKFTFTCCL